MVKREKFLEDARADPGRFYRVPNDILRDRRLTDEDRREILSAWQRKLGNEQIDAEPAVLELISRALQELDSNSEISRARRNSTA